MMDCSFIDPLFLPDLTGIDNDDDDAASHDKHLTWIGGVRPVLERKIDPLTHFHIGQASVSNWSVGFYEYIEMSFSE